MSGMWTFPLHIGRYGAIVYPTHDLYNEKLTLLFMKGSFLIFQYTFLIYFFFPVCIGLL